MRESRARRIRTETMEAMRRVYLESGRPLPASRYRVVARSWYPGHHGTVRCTGFRGLYRQAKRDGRPRAPASFPLETRRETRRRTRRAPNR